MRQIPTRSDGCDVEDVARTASYLLRYASPYRASEATVRAIGSPTGLSQAAARIDLHGLAYRLHESGGCAVIDVDLLSGPGDAVERDRIIDAEVARAGAQEGDALAAAEEQRQEAMWCEQQTLAFLRLRQLKSAEQAVRAEAAT